MELLDFPFDLWEIVIQSVLQSPVDEELGSMPQMSLLRNNSDMRRGQELRGASSETRVYWSE